MLALKPMCYFSSHALAFGFWDAPLQDNILMTTANKRTCNCEYYYLFHESHSMVIPVLEVHGLLTKICDILGKVFSKEFGNAAHILAFLLNSSFRQCHEVWDLQFPFHNAIEDTVSPGEAFLCSCIKWNLALVQQKLFWCQSLNPMTGGKANTG